MVRVGPNHLSFTDPRAWRAIYGHRVGESAAPGHTAEMSKAPPFTTTIRDVPTSIINADREEHSRLRRGLSHGFSDAARKRGFVSCFFFFSSPSFLPFFSFERGGGLERGGTGFGSRS